MLEKTRSRSRIKKHGKTKAEKDWLSRVAALPCCICKCAGVEVHHIRTGVGMGKRAGHYETIPLCFEHHMGNSGIHGLGRKAFERKYSITELELLKEVYNKLAVLGAVPIRTMEKKIKS